ncbi:MAG TPA: glycoside hydrolase family 28 protein [Candidatus Ruania gallistercoris]|uniref:Glycoside hydrolase family 28 protein n=1 Tax=Candidatus Ruania gallistercoris TaxID=2838746 RepID=A0A9D2EEX0_9MICO|nr:glycoside hydrolase family 28 protein [Candidatus Ruania gallistercoris]
MRSPSWNDGPGWHRAEEIVHRVQAPTFPDRDFAVEDFGALGDGETDCTAAIAAAMHAAHEAGGGRVVLTEGTYCTGPIQLLSNTNLHVREGATALFSTDPDRYLPLVATRWQGVEVMGYSPLVRAADAENVAITGTGTLDGGAANENWWPWSGRSIYGWREGIVAQEDDWPALLDLVRRGIPPEERLVGPGWRFRPNMIEFLRCRNVWIQGVTVRRSPMWVIHPVLCTGVLAEDITVISHGPNNDGFDPECCTDVVIRRCHFDVGDDSIAIKSGREDDGERVGVPSRNIVIEECTMTMKYGAFTIGSELTGGVSDVYVRNCRIGGPGLYYGLYIKTNAARGGYVENVYVDGVEASHLQRELISCNLHRGEGLDGPRTPVVRNIDIRNVRLGQAKRALHVAGFAHSPVTDLRITDCVFESMTEEDAVSDVVGLVQTNVTRGGPTEGAPS